MSQLLDPEITKLGQAALQSQRDGEMKFDLGKFNIVYKLLSTPLTRSSMSALIPSFLLIIGSWLLEISWMGTVGALGLVITAIYSLVVPVWKPDLARSEAHVMFIAVIAFAQRILEQPSTMNGSTIAEVIEAEHLAQPAEPKAAKLVQPARSEVVKAEQQ